MQLYSGLLFLALAIVLVSAKDIRYGDEDNDSSGDESQMLHADYKYHPSPALHRRLLQLLRQLDSNAADADRYPGVIKRAKAITKGDPREFMG